MRSLPTSLVVAFSLLASLVVAEVKVVVQPDGTSHMFNSGSRRYPARAASSGVAGRQSDLDAVIERFSRDSRVDEELVRAVITAESGFDPRAVSRRGAMGLMQLMPETARALNVENPFDPVENVRAGARYLRQMLDVFDEDLELALAAYNAGPNAVRRFGGVPPYRETFNYVEKVMRLYRDEPGYALRHSNSIGKGRRTYLTRDSRGTLVLTTTPPRGSD